MKRLIARTSQQMTGRNPVLSEVSVIPDGPAANQCVAVFKLLAVAEIAEDAGDLSAYRVYWGLDGCVDDSRADKTGDKLASFVESCASMTADTIKELNNTTAGMPEFTQAIVANAGCHEVAIRLLSSTEMSALNRDYRSKDGPTNVLSFPALDIAVGSIDTDPDNIGFTNFITDFENPECNGQPRSIAMPLGDIAICVDVVSDEARQQGKPVVAHLAHMVVHGLLHLLGYDHVSEQEAGVMEAAEIFILDRLGFVNPYIAIQHEVAKKNS